MSVNSTKRTDPASPVILQKVSIYPVQDVESPICAATKRKKHIDQVVHYNSSMYVISFNFNQ